MKNLLILIIFIAKLTYSQNSDDKTVHIISNQEALQISDIKTVHLVFKNKIKYIDVGSQFFITDTIGAIIKIKHTGKGLEQPKISHKSNLTVLTDDGFLYTFPIIYSRDIMYSSFRINDNVDVLTEYRKKVVKKIQDQLEDNLLCNKFKYTTDFLKLKDKNDQLEMQITGIYYFNNKIAFKLKISNHSNLDYEIDNILIRTKLNQRISPNYLYQEKIYKPIASCNNKTVIKGNETNYTQLLLYDKFTPKKNEKLYFDIFEKNGGRSVSVFIPRDKIFDANILK